MHLPAEAVAITITGSTQWRKVTVVKQNFLLLSACENKKWVEFVVLQDYLVSYEHVSCDINVFQFGDHDPDQQHEYELHQVAGESTKVTQDSTSFNSGRNFACQFLFSYSFIALSSLLRMGRRGEQESNRTCASSASCKADALHSIPFTGFVMSNNLWKLPIAAKEVKVALCT